MKNYIAIDRAIDSLLQKTADPGALRPSGAGGVKRRDNDRGGNHAAHGEFVAAAEDGVGECAQRHFENVGMKSRRMNKPETLELAKPAETTYFGVQIAFAQDLVRYARRVGADYEEAINFRGSPDPARDATSRGSSAATVVSPTCNCCASLPTRRCSTGSSSRILCESASCSRPGTQPAGAKSARRESHRARWRSAFSSIASR
jgi:hypothetical protein